VTPMNIKVDHPKLAFKVEGGELKVSYDGTTYEATGVKVSEYTAHVIGDVVVAEDGKSVTVKIGDKTLELPLVTKDVAALGLSQENFFLRYSAEKVIKITAENLSEIYVMNQPDGWNAVIADNDLTIASPTKKAIEIGAAQAKGLVLVHATDEDGKCIVAALEVSTGEGLTISVDSEGNVEIRNAYTSLQKSPNPMIDMEFFGFSPFHFGIMSAQDYYSFEENFDGMTFEEAWIEWREPPCPNTYLPYNVFDMGEYVEGVYEVDVINTTVAELTSLFGELPYGPYVLWVASDDGTGRPADGVQTVEYQKMNLVVNVAETSFNEVKIKLTAQGADMYLIGGVPTAKYEEAYPPRTFDEYMTDPDQRSMGPWVHFTEYGVPNAMGQIVAGLGEQEVEFELSPYILDSRGAKMNFDSSYDFWVMPIFEYMIKYDKYGAPDFSAFDYEANFKPYHYTVKTASVTEGQVAAPTIETKSSYTGVSAQIAPAEGSTVYYAFISSEQLLELENNKAKFDYLLENCDWPLTNNDEISERLKAGETTILLTAVVSSEGNYAVAYKELSALIYPTEANDNITLTIASPVVTLSTISTTITPAEGTTMYYDYLSDSMLASLSDDAAKLQYLLSKSPKTAETTALAEYLSPSDKRTLLVAVIDADNKYKIFSQEATTSSLVYTPGINVSLVSMTYDKSSYSCVVKFKVEGANKVVLKAADEEPSAKTSTEVYAMKQDQYNVYYADVDADGYATYTYENAYQSQVLYVVGSNVDGTNVTIGEAQKYEFVNYPAE